MAFRFFINVDCLNMYNFDFFFYKKRSEHQLMLYPDVFIGEGTGIPFYKAAFDIRSYLDRLPHNADEFQHDVNDYQIIIAMRSDFVTKAETWRDTLLFRLLQVDFDLRRANILIRSGLGSEIAVDLVMLHETSVVKNVHTFNTLYLNSDRFEYDCSLLLAEIGIPKGKENDPNEVSLAFERYCGEHAEALSECGRMPDGTPADALYVFVRDLIEQLKKDEEDGTAAMAGVSVAGAARTVLKDYSVFELFVDQTNANKKTCTLLRVIEYATADFAFPVGMTQTSRLADQCEAYWKQIAAMPDNDIGMKYSQMLNGYKTRLKTGLIDIEQSSNSNTNNSRLPDTNIPDENDIGISESEFEDENEEKKLNIDPKALVESLKKKLHHIKEFDSLWNTAYSEIRSAFSRLGESLKEYSSQLGHIYAEKCGKRKMTEYAWNSSTYLEDADTQNDIKKLKNRKEDLLEELKQPQMTPSLTLQDQLNMETALEDENQSIRQYVRCIRSLTTKNFLLLAVLVTGFAALSYFLFQPYVFEETVTILIAVGYIVLSFILMMFTWKRPHSFYNHEIKACLDRLQGEMDVYIRGYYDRAAQFRKYVNIINRLDYIERHLRVKTRAVETSAQIAEAKKWHASQIKLHLNKLDFFSGIMEKAATGNSDENQDAEIQASYDPEISPNHIDDVIDAVLYWPQG